MPTQARAEERKIAAGRQSANTCTMLWAQTCRNAAASLQRLPLGAVRSKAAKRGNRRRSGGGSRRSRRRLARPRHKKQPPHPSYTRPQLRPLVLEPPVVLRPHYLGGSSAIASVENTLELELDSEAGRSSTGRSAACGHRRQSYFRAVGADRSDSARIGFISFRSRRSLQPDSRFERNCRRSCERRGRYR